jgi:hypothetical protein
MSVEDIKRVANAPSPMDVKRRRAQRRNNEMLAARALGLVSIRETPKVVYTSEAS